MIKISILKIRGKFQYYKFFLKEINKLDNYHFPYAEIHNQTMRYF